MSNEFGANSTKNNTLVDDTAFEQNPENKNVDNYANDPTDTTASGGYGGNAFSDRSQRGLVDGSLDRGQFGRPNSTTSGPDDKTPTEHRDPLNPYGESGPGTPDNGEWQNAPEKDASRVADRRSEQHESGGDLENDIGA